MRKSSSMPDFTSYSSSSFTSAYSRPNAFLPAAIICKVLSLNAIVFLLLTLLVSPSTAAEAGQSRQIENLVISATRFASDADNLAVSISQLSADQLNTVSHVHIQELLQRVPGVNLHRGSGQEYLPAIRSPVFTGPGACGGIYTAEDGIPLRSAGFCNINELFEAHTEQAERIEIIRGPGTALYGSNALHGVINVITPGVSDSYRSRLGVEIGPDDFTRLSFGGNHRQKNWGVSAHLTVAHDGGFRDDSGYDQQKLSLRHEYTGDRLSVDTGLSITSLNQETAGFIVGADAFTSKAISESNDNPEAFRDAMSARLWSRIDYNLNEQSRVQITPYLRYTDMDFLQHFLPGDPLEQNGQQSAGLQTAYYFDVNDRVNLVAGVDAEVTDSFLTQDQDAPTQGSAFLQETVPQGNHYDYQVDATSIAPYVHMDWLVIPALTLSAGVRFETISYQYDNLARDGRTRDDGTECGFGGCRYNRPADRNDRFSNWSPKLGVSYQIQQNQFVYLNLSRGFRAPQATELYRLQRAQTVADLDSESLDSIELGAKGRTDKLSYQLAIYQLQKDNVIFRDSDFFNVSNGATRHRGVELQLDYQLGRSFDIGINANFARHDYRNSLVLNGIDILDNDVDTAPRYFGSAQLGWRPIEKARVELQWSYVGRYYLDPENRFDYPGHDLFHLRAQWSPTPAVEISARLTNLADTRYAERADFTSFTQQRYFPGNPRSLVVGFTWHWR